MKPRKTFSVYVLLIGVMGLLIVGGLLAFQLFKQATQSQLTKEQKEAIRPLDGSIDEKIVADLEKRIVFSNDDLKVVRAIVTPTPSIQPTITPTPTEASISATPSPLASPSAQPTSEITN